MPRKRQPAAIWKQTRRRILKRDHWRCVHCGIGLTLSTGHIDHIQAGAHGSNADANPRSLCRRCHVLRAENHHYWLIAKAVRDGIIPPDWRPLVWDDY